MYEQAIKTLILPLVLSGCVTYGPASLPPLKTAVLPEACYPELPGHSEVACNAWFYELGIAQAGYDESYMDYASVVGAEEGSYFVAGYEWGRAYKARHGSVPTTATGYPTSTDANSMLNMPAQPGGIDRYGNDQATGPVINGEHHGIPAGPPKKTCHGAILNGVCTGPEF